MAEILVRPEQPGDRQAVFRLNEQAFDSPAEAALVEAVRAAAEPGSLISLVAELEREIVGHAFFTPVTIRRDDAVVAHAMALGPMAVLPAHQRKGIGSRLVEAGLAACRKRGEGVVFVLGHREYYPRFGFQLAAPRGLTYKSPDSDPYFFVHELEPGALDGLRGRVEYLPAFEEV